MTGHASRTWLTCPHGLHVPRRRPSTAGKQTKNPSKHFKKPKKAMQNNRSRYMDPLVVAIFTVLCLIMAVIPTGFEDRVANEAVRCRGEVLEVDNSSVQELGLIKTGDQTVTLRLLDGPYEGRVVSGNNPLMGMMDRDKVFAPGDTALVVLSLDAAGNIAFVNPQEHYRLGLVVLLIGLFALFLIGFGGWTGVKALLSFVLTALALWKLLVPLMLKGVDPIWLTLGLVAFLTAAILFLVAGFNRRGVAAFTGAFLGVLTSCLLAIVFTHKLHLHGAVMPFAETLLYAGFNHLDLTRIYIAAVFLAASGAVMDLAMDVSASMYEVVQKKPHITRMEALASGMTVARAVVGTMTTTLLFAYSGGFITLLMAFKAQGVPLTNLFNVIYVAAEVLKTLVGSFGLIMVGPFTAVVGAVLFVRKPERVPDKACDGKLDEDLAMQAPSS